MELTQKPVKAFSEEIRKVWKIYDASFPEEERNPRSRLRAIGREKCGDFTAYYDGERFCGFSLCIVVERHVYVLYLAVDPAFRSCGYGSAILAAIRQKYPDKDMALCIEDPEPTSINYEQRMRRKRFYEKNGLHESEIIVVGRPNLMLLTTAETFTVAEYRHIFNSVLRGIWMPDAQLRTEYMKKQEKAKNST